MTRKDSLKYRAQETVGRTDLSASDAEKDLAQKRKIEQGELDAQKKLKPAEAPVQNGGDSKAAVAATAQGGNPNYYDIIYPWSSELNLSGDAERSAIIGNAGHNVEHGLYSTTKKRQARQAIAAAGLNPYGNNGEMGRLYWTENMDNLLREAVGIHGLKKWVAVAQHVGHGTDNNQCLNRWITKVNPELVTVKRGPWSEEEVLQLTELVQNTPDMIIHEHRKENSAVNWVAIGERLNRTRQDCKGKWQNILHKSLKTGPFSGEEDEIIIQHAMEWGDRGPGLWVRLEKELGRPGRRIRDRWAKIQSNLQQQQNLQNAAAAAANSMSK